MCATMSTMEHLEEGGPIPPETRRLAGLLGREKTGEMLALIGARPHQSASEVARTLDIHVATAQRYLKDMVDAGLLRVRERRGGTRPTEEYWLAEEQIHIQIDLSRTGGPVPEKRLVAEAERYAVRDAGVAEVVYDVDGKTGYVHEVLLLSDGGRREVRGRVHIPAAVGRFLVEVPAADEPARTVWDVARRAGLPARSLPELLGAVGVLGGGARPGDTGAADRLVRLWGHHADALRVPGDQRILAVTEPDGVETTDTKAGTERDPGGDVDDNATRLVEATPEGSA